ncbi:MAG: SDR family oxidoreductase [Akkermansiaceae bacterium]|nr:SDR family oxidoreductase [Armatimonadota bacterium]
MITGANRGIGLEFARQFLERGDSVFAGCRVPGDANELWGLSSRFPGRLSVVTLDVADENCIAAARADVGETMDTLDLLVNNAGTFATGEHGLARIDSAKMAHVFAVNAIGPALVAKHFVDLVKRGTDPLIANLTSGVGLLTNRIGSPGGQYSYAASKSALNLVIRSLSFDLQPEGISVIGIGPGYVRTDMTRGGSATLLPDESVRGMIATFDRITLADTGRFFSWQNREDDWMTSA